VTRGLLGSAPSKYSGFFDTAISAKTNLGLALSALQAVGKGENKLVGLDNGPRGSM
jgi:hypothetical protein